MCSMSCDDKCPNKVDPFACGGWQMLRRQVIIANNEYGLKCPYLETKRKCQQIKCPVDCVMSKWSSYSQCTREACGGGVQGRSRSILTQPNNGGLSCNTVVETRPCNTGACDRNCRLKRWSKWSPCSVACDGGFQEKWRLIL